MKRGWWIASIVIIIIIILLISFIYIFSSRKTSKETDLTKNNLSVDNKEKTCASNGRMCGGIAGILCCDNLICDYGENEGMPDASGICR